jgi:hypothetical protein
METTAEREGAHGFWCKYGLRLANSPTGYLLPVPDMACGSEAVFFSRNSTVRLANYTGARRGRRCNRSKGF